MRIPAPREKLAGCDWLPRILAKARLLEQGQLPAEYAARFCDASGVDGQFMAFFKLTRDAIVAAAALPEPEAAEWFLKLPGVSPRRIEEWNYFAEHLGRPGFPMAERLPIAKSTVYKQVDTTGIDTVFGVLEADEQVPAAKPIRVGVVLFEGFEVLDVFGPLEMFGLLGERAQVLLLGESAGPIRSGQGAVVLAEGALETVSPLDVLLIPGGIGTRGEVSNAHFLGLLKAQAQAARFATTVCTGSALLARTGLLDGKRATSNKRSFAWVKSQGASVHWVPEARWVEDGKFFTSAGVAAGMDMTLALIAHLFDRDTSLQVAARAEYEWHENPAWDPFARIHRL
jgi:putative intracellular protease/amidase